MSKYIVWRDYYSEGWQRSEELETLEDCFKYLQENSYGNPYLITKKVDVQFTEVDL